MKSFKFEADNTKYKADDFIKGVFINPLLPEDFWTEPLENRSEEHMKHWEAMPFILVEGGFYKVYCLDGGAWDRPTLRGGFDTQAQAINFIIEKYQA